MTSVTHATSKQHTFTDIEVMQFAARVQPETVRRVSPHEGRQRASITSGGTRVPPLAFHYGLPCSKVLYQNSKANGQHMFCCTRVLCRHTRRRHARQNGAGFLTQLLTKFLFFVCQCERVAAGDH
ncbi:hypothetical protein TRVL_08405 [Trypanosoma vivax]|nr:hypothetical protein TRVL_08405 [Trypanosoma vivax]